MCKHYIIKENKELIKERIETLRVPAAAEFFFPKTILLTQFKPIAISNITYRRVNQWRVET